MSQYAASWQMRQRATPHVVSVTPHATLSHATHHAHTSYEIPPYIIRRHTTCLATCHATYHQPLPTRNANAHDTISRHTITNQLPHATQIHAVCHVTPCPHVTSHCQHAMQIHTIRMRCHPITNQSPHTTQSHTACQNTPCPHITNHCHIPSHDMPCHAMPCHDMPHTAVAAPR